ARIPRLECHLELGNREWLRDGHLVLGTFTGIAVRLALRRAHDEFAGGGDDHHRAAARTFLESRAPPCPPFRLLLDPEDRRGHPPSPPMPRPASPGPCPPIPAHQAR